MLATLARGTVLLFLALMIMVWILSLGRNASAPSKEQPPYSRLYS